MDKNRLYSPPRGDEVLQPLFLRLVGPAFVSWVAGVLAGLIAVLVEVAKEN